MKKAGKALLLALVLTAMPVAAFAAGSSSSSDNSSVETSSSTAAAGNTAVASMTVVTASGSRVEVKGAVTDGNGVTTGIVENGSGAGIAVGEAKTAGLPEETVSVIREVERGNLSAVPDVDTTGLKGYGITVAVRAEEGNVPTTLYVSVLPENGVVRVLFYNNYTGRWTLIDASVDQKTSTVSFIAPISGTALVVG